MVIPSGAHVLVSEMIADAQICKVQYQGQIGLFKMQDFVKAAQLRGQKSQSPAKR